MLVAGEVASPMLLSTPSLTCSETISHSDEESQQSCPEDYTKEIFAYLREAEVSSLSFCLTLMYIFIITIRR